MDFAVQNHARSNIVAGGNSMRINMFTVRIDPHSDHRFLNYAVPDEGADPTTDQVAELVAAFTSRSLIPRLEYLPSRAPKLEAALLSAGFSQESRMPLMVCAPGEVTAASPPTGVTLRAATTMDEFAPAVAVQYAAFGESENPTEADVRSRMADPVARGGGAVVALTADGTVVGTGQFGTPIDTVTEVAGIAVHPDHQGRGVGAAVTAHLTTMAHELGCRTVWLDPSGDTAQRLYQRIGYRIVGEKLHIVQEPV